MVDGDGAVVASEPAAAAEVAAAADRLWTAAGRRAGDLGGAGLEDLVVPLADGAVAVVEAHGHRAMALTGPRPGVGLLLFDLRTCLADAFATSGEAR